MGMTVTFSTARSPAGSQGKQVDAVTGVAHDDPLERLSGIPLRVFEQLRGPFLARLQVDVPGFDVPAVVADVAGRPDIRFQGTASKVTVFRHVNSSQPPALPGMAILPHPSA